MDAELEVAESLSLPGRLSRVLFAPGRVFSALKANCRWPDWVVPATIVAVVSLASIYLTFPIVAGEQFAEQRRRIEASQDMTAEQKATALAGIEKWQGAGRVVGLAGVPVGVAAGLFVQAVVFLLALRVLLDTRANYREMLAITGYSMLTAVPAALVHTPLVLAKGTAEVSTGLGLLVPAGSEGTFISYVLSGVDIFTAWQMVLVTVGISTLYTIPPRRAGNVVFGLWALWILITAAFRTVVHLPS